jgi:uncharacterized membrane protein YhfC
MTIDSLFISHALNGLLMIGMPVALGIYLNRKFRLGWRLWFIGAAGFIISQALHIPFNSLATRLFIKNFDASLPAAGQLLFNAIFLGLSAGLFEEITRYLVMRFWVKNARSWGNGVVLGAGHGGAEAIILGGLGLYAFIQLVALRNADLSKVIPAAQLAQVQAQLSAYWSMTWYTSLLGALERFFTIPIQICLAVMVMQVFTRKRLYWLGLAILWHAIIDAVAVYASGVFASYSWSAYVLEGIVGLFWLISLGILFALRRPEPTEPPQPPLEPVAPAPFRPSEVKETPENLEDSRFNTTGEN